MCVALPLLDRRRSFEKTTLDITILRIIASTVCSCVYIRYSPSYLATAAAFEASPRRQCILTGSVLHSLAITPDFTNRLNDYLIQTTITIKQWTGWLINKSNIQSKLYPYCNNNSVSLSFRYECNNYIHTLHLKTSLVFSAVPHLLTQQNGCNKTI